MYRLATLSLVLSLPLFAATGAAHEPHRDQRESSMELGHHHRFRDAEAWAKRFEDPARDRWQRPEQVLERLELTPASRVAEIGSATGYFAVRLARRAPDGRVWGVDIEPDMVRFLNRRARAEGINNLFSVLGTPDDPLIPEPVELVLIVDTYHHIEARPAYFRALKKQLGPRARVAIVDFKRGSLPVGPLDSGKLSPAQVKSELRAAGYRLVVEDLETLPYQYLLIFADRAAAR